MNEKSWNKWQNKMVINNKRAKAAEPSLGSLSFARFPHSSHNFGIVVEWNLLAPCSDVGKEKGNFE